MAIIARLARAPARDEALGRPPFSFPSLCEGEDAGGDGDDGPNAAPLFPHKTNRPTTHDPPIKHTQHTGAGSTKNGRDSKSKSRGVKAYGGQPIRAGAIIVRQTGSTWHAGDNVGTGKDYTLFSTVDGVVVYHKRGADMRSEVAVFPHGDPRAVASLTASHTRQAKEGVPSRQERRRALYSPRGGAAGGAPLVAAAAVAPMAGP